MKKKFLSVVLFFVALPNIYALPIKSFLFTTSALAAFSVYKKPICASKPVAYVLEQVNDKTGLSFQNNYEKIAYNLLQRFPELSPAFLVYALENSIDANKTSLFDEIFIEKHKHYMFSSDYKAHVAETYAKHIIKISKNKLEDCYKLSATSDAENSLDAYYVRNLFKRAAEKNLTTIPTEILEVILKNATVEDILSIKETIVQKNKIQPFEQSSALLELLKKQ